MGRLKTFGLNFSSVDPSYRSELLEQVLDVFYALNADPDSELDISWLSFKGCSDEELIKLKAPLVAFKERKGDLSTIDN